VDRLRVDAKPTGDKLTLSAARANLPLPGPVAPDRYFAQDDHVIVQLRNTAGGCWNVRFGGSLKNTATRYQAKNK
jgi:hypothetical protein